MKQMYCTGSRKMVFTSDSAKTGDPCPKCKGSLRELFGKLERGRVNWYVKDEEPAPAEQPALP